MEKSLRARALDALARREYSRVELGRKLSAHSADEAELALLLDELESRGWLSDARFAEQLAHARQSRYGSRSIVYELREQGVAEALIEVALETLKPTEMERARRVWEKKFGTVAVTAKERGQQIRFLQMRGFDPEVIYRLLDNPADAD
ncbi:MAG TPA: recombination regulator RecX [Burkholderiales bacterium]|nr:recombination regulator RecX [Burkholderiales bacterium]